MNLTIVTVTYGSRAHLLTQVLDAAREQGATQAVVIDNGSADPVRDILAARYGGWALVHGMGRNAGSALGFKTGMETALCAGAELILLLDDDNVPARGCIANLLRHWRETRDAGAMPAAFAVHARRGAAGGQARGRFQQPRAGSFLGFHIAEIPYKLVRRIAPGLLDRARPEPEDETRIAPYGGMMFHRAVLAKIGLPNEAYFLYTDDYEFSHRLTSDGGKIFMTEDAAIRDIDTTWGNAQNHQQSALFTGRLKMKNPSKLYYATRNMVHFQHHVRAQRGIAYAVNRACFIAILTCLALTTRTMPQYRIILKGMRDGQNTMLGAHPAFQL